MVNSDVKGIVPKNNKDAYSAILDWTKKSTKWRSDCINLIASENVVSPAVNAAIISDFGHRYAEGWPGKRYYQGTWMFDEVELIGQELVKRLFECSGADISPLSGANANLATLMSLCKSGDKIMSMSLQAGAHITQTDVSSAGIMGLESVYMPFDEGRMNLDTQGCIEAIKTEKPKLVITAGSVYLFPHPVKEISETAHDIGANVMYDGAHVAGLIAGKAFPNPFKEGADVVTFSSHKTFPGPQGAMILTNGTLDEKFAKKLKYSTFPKLISNHHLHHVAGKAIAAAEMLEFGEAYAHQIVKNAKAFGAALDSEGIIVLAKDYGYTESHQVLVDVRELGGGGPAVDTLEKSNIVTSKQLLPWDGREDVENPSGIRLGTQEMTRLGMKESEMKEIARFIRRVIIDKEEPSKIAAEVKEFKLPYHTVKYCFDEGEAYDFISKII